MQTAPMQAHRRGTQNTKPQSNMTITTVKSYVASAAQEATETAAQTKAEAAKGDQQAIRKLASQQAAHHTNSAPQPTQAPNVTNRGINAVA